MTILCYHAVDPSWSSPLSVEPVAFANHCRWLSRARRVMPLVEAVRAMRSSCRLPRGTAALTFDDGFASVYEHALPVLVGYGLPATVFVVAETLSSEGRDVDWVRNPPPQRLTTLTVEQLLEMRSAGVAVGSHSYSHRDLVTLSNEECERDLRMGRELLEDLLRAPVRHLAYPRGLHDERVRQAAERAGFDHAFSLPERTEPKGPFSIPRVGVYGGNSVGVVRMKAMPWYLGLRTSSFHNLATASARFVSGGPGRQG